MQSTRQLGHWLFRMPCSATSATISNEINLFTTSVTKTRIPLPSWTPQDSYQRFGNKQSPTQFLRLPPQSIALFPPQLRKVCEPIDTTLQRNLLTSPLVNLAVEECSVPRTAQICSSSLCYRLDKASCFSKSSWTSQKLMRETNQDYCSTITLYQSKIMSLTLMSSSM